MDPTDIWIIWGLGTLMCVHYIQFLQTMSRKSTETIETAIWLLFIIGGGIVGICMTTDALMVMADQKPDMRLGVPVAMAIYIAHVSIMDDYLTDNAAVYVSRLLIRALIYTWVFAQAEYRWALCTALVRFISVDSESVNPDGLLLG
ncbi:hypothetical protein GQX73_g2920 [Xylaria multiplex]|uniref:Uncharacterized protein n=1 Tax=Xylaria multiplex TaxID=323545 RepID=A0A7C8MXM0_9PEZI|nr:hypothetical protein GQX73_g2920 [Xylaria multiplex]